MLMKKNNKNINILIAVIVAIFAIVVVKDMVVKIAVENGVGIVTGLKLKIGGINVGVLKPAVAIRNLKLLNPPAFPDRNMVDMPEIYVKYDLPAILGGTVHLPEARLALKEFIVVKNADGKLNLDSLKNVQAQKESRGQAQKPAGKAPKIRIDTLKLSIGKVIYKDYSRGGAPSVREFNINLNESYSNVDNPYALANLIVVKALMNTTIGSLANFDVKGLQGSVKDTMASAQKMAASAHQGAAEAAQKASKAAQDAQEAAKQTADTMKNVFKNPFG